jgi:two-component system, cell cycle sensor histidine kinase and response regulator CckA
MSPRRSQILIVEDEEHVGELAAIFLAEAGFDSKVARSAAEALRIWDEFMGAIDMAISDWVLPDLFGDQLVIRLLDQKPSLKVIFISGNPVASIDSPFPLIQGVNYLQKPFRYPELVKLVQRTLSTQKKDFSEPHEKEDSSNFE